MQRHRSLVYAYHLDRGIELDLVAIDRNAAVGEQLRKIARRHRAVELPGLGGLTQNREGLAVELGADLLSFALELEIARFELRLHGLEALLVVGGGAQGLALGQEKVARIAV